MSRSSVDIRLSDEHYQEFLRRVPRSTIAQVHAWLTELGYKLSLTAVGRKMANLRPALSPEAIVREQALTPLPLGRHAGPPASIKTAVARLRAALPCIYDRELRAKVEDHARLIEHVAGLATKGK